MSELNWSCGWVVIVDGVVLFSVVHCWPFWFGLKFESKLKVECSNVLIIKFQ